MTSDLDRVRMLNATENLARKLATAPHGITSLRASMLDAAAGVKGQNYDGDNRSDRYETVVDHLGVFAARVPGNDPTGEQAIAPDQARVDLANLDRLLTRLYKTVQDIGGLHDKWTPQVGAKRPSSTEDGPGDDWCSSCWRDAKHLEPASARYKGVCRWCGDYQGERGEYPPLPILQARHRGERITTAMVERAGRQQGRKTA